MAHRQDRRSLIEEGKRLVQQQEASGWRLAEIVHDLHDDGMSYRAIADEIGTSPSSVKGLNRMVVLYPTQDRPFYEAFILAQQSPDRATAIDAVADVEGLSVGHAERHRRPETKAIAAGIAALPEAEKEQVARELANDPGFMADALAEHGKQRTAERTPGRTPTPMEKAINTARLRIAISKAEEAAQTVLDGVTRSDLDEDDIASLERSSHRARVLADYIDAVLGVGDMDKALEALLS